jgi:rRNA maturation protein Nop10
MKTEILFNDELNDYTLQKEVNGVKSYKKVPLKYKPDDTTAKFRQEILKNQLVIFL